MLFMVGFDYDPKRGRRRRASNRLPRRHHCTVTVHLDPMVALPTAARKHESEPLEAVLDEDEDEQQNHRCDKSNTKEVHRRKVYETTAMKPTTAKQLP